MILRRVTCSVCVCVCVCVCRTMCSLLVQLWPRDKQEGKMEQIVDRCSWLKCVCVCVCSPWLCVYLSGGLCPDMCLETPITFPWTSKDVKAIKGSLIVCVWGGECVCVCVCVCVCINCLISGLFDPVQIFKSDVTETKLITACLI